MEPEPEASVNLATPRYLTMIPSMEKEINALLEPGEQLLWKAQPDAWHYTRPTFMLYIAGVPWAVFTFFWLDAVTGGFEWPKKVTYPYPSWTPWVAITAGIILLIAAIWMLSAPYWIWRKSRRAIYFVTDKRAVVADTAHPAKNEILPLDGSVSFRIKEPTREVSDLEIVSGESKGLLLRAVGEPAKVVSQISAARGAAVA